MLSCAELQSGKLGPDQKCKDFMTRNMTNYHSAYRKKDYPIHDHKQNQARMRGLKRKAENQMTESDSSKNHDPHIENRLGSAYQLGTKLWTWCKTYIFQEDPPESADSATPPSPTNQENYKSRFNTSHHDVSHKRRKFTKVDNSLRSSKSMINLHTRKDCAIVDISKYGKDKARQEIDKFWEPNALPWAQQKLASEQQFSSQECQLSEERIMGSKVAPRRFSDSESDIFKYKPDSHFKQSLSELEQYHKYCLEERYNYTEYLEKSFKELLLDTSSSLVFSEFKIAQNLARAKEREKKLKQEKIDKARQRRLHRSYPQQKLVRNLDPYWEDRVRRAHSSRGDGTLTTSIGGTELRSKDFNTLLDCGAWLNDEIINAYIEWIVDAANQAAQAEAVSLGIKLDLAPKFIAHNSFFYETLKRRGPAGLDRLMKRKGAFGKLLLGVDSIFIPICSGAHWTLGVVRPVAKTIEYFDSMGGNPSAFISNAQNWLKHQLGEAYLPSEWTAPQTPCTYQTNSYDCGVFVCTNALCVALGLDTCCYTQADMTYQRRNIAAVLLNRGFSGDFALKASEDDSIY